MANPRKLRKIEPYDPNAFDGDNDGIVQDGTAWERPAGVRIFDRSGQEIMPGRISETAVSDLVYRDQNGSILDFKPKYEGSKDQQQQRPGDGLGSTLEERRGTIGQDRTLGDRVRQQREREAARAEQERQLAEQQAAADAARQRREQFAAIIDNLPVGGPDDPDPFINIDSETESVATATAKANLIFGLLAQALALKSDPTRIDQSPDIDPDRLDEQIERLNRAAKALFGMNIEGPINETNAGKYAQVVANLNQAFGKSIRDQALLSKYIDDIERASLDGSLDSATPEFLERMDATLRLYSGFAEAADTAENTSFDFDQNQAQIARQLRDQHFKYLVANDKISKIESAQKKLRDIYYNKISENWGQQKDGSQGVLKTLYPGIELQPNDPSLGNTTQNHPNPENPLPVPVNNGLNIDVDIEELEPGSDVERAVILQASIEHLRNGGSLSDIPNDYWIDALSASASDAEIDTDNPFYEVIPAEGAISVTRIYWRRNPDGSPSDQGWVTKAQPWSVNAADHAGWNLAAALGIFPEGSNWGGSIGVQPTDATDWLDEMPVIVAPIVWNHLPTNGDLSRIDQNRSYQHGEPGQGAAKRHLAAILHTWLIGDEDRNPGNTMSGHLDGETYVFPIDFGGSGGFADRRELPDYIGIGQQYGNYVNFAENVQAYRQTLTPEQRRKFDQEMIDTYDSMLQRAEQVLRNNSEEEFIETMMPQNVENYPSMDREMMRRELAAVYGGLQNGTRIMRQKRNDNLRAILGDDYDQNEREVDVDDDFAFEISNNMADTQPAEIYDQDRLEKAEFNPKQNPPNALLIGEKFAETTDATAEEIYDALDPIYDDLIEQEVKPDMKAVLKAVKENDIQELGRILTRSLGQAWNQSTTSKFSVILSHVARGEFEKRGIRMAPEFTKLPRNPETGEALDAAEIIDNHMLNDPEFSRAREIIGQLLMAQYDTTQDYLRDNGISEVRVYRGLYVLNSDERQFDIEAGGGNIQTAQRTISSWGLNLEVADSFAVAKIEVDGEEPDTNGYGVILHNVVPAEEVFSIATNKNYGPRKKTKRPEPRGGVAEWENVGFGEPSEDEIILIGAERTTDYIIKPNDIEITQENLDNRLLNPADNDFVFEVSNDLTEPPKPPSLGNYTQQQLDDADYNARPVDVVPPTTKSVAQQAAQNGTYSPAETAEALHLAGIFPKFEGQYPFRVQQAVENNDIEAIYEQALEKIQGNWNGQVTDPFPEFFKDMVAEELSESFGIEFGPDYARGDQTPGQRKLPQAYTPEAERGRQIIKQIANAHYQAVQQYLADQGIEEVRIYRGLMTGTGEGTDFPGNAGTRPLEMRPLSSWTTDYDIAARFSSRDLSSGDGVILHQTIPAKYIFSIRPSDDKLTPENRPDAQGLGTTYESEVIPIHSKLPYDYIVTGNQKIPKETVDQILKGEIDWQRPPKRTPETGPLTSVAGSDYLNLTDEELATIDPSSLSTGMVIYNPDRNQYMIWNGATWVPQQNEPDIVG
jgi:PAS domain-containing protein